MSDTTTSAPGPSPAVVAAKAAGLPTAEDYAAVIAALSEVYSCLELIGFQIRPSLATLHDEDARLDQLSAKQRPTLEDIGRLYSFLECVRAETCAQTRELERLTTALLDLDTIRQDLESEAA